MPTSDRRPRRRLRAADAAEITSDQAMELMRQARDGLRDWDEIRARCVRALIAPRLDADSARRAFDAWRKRPDFLPGRRPQGAADE